MCESSLSDTTEKAQSKGFFGQRYIADLITSIG